MPPYCLAVRQRGQLLAHIQNTHHQYNLPTPRARINYRCNREGIAEQFSDPAVFESVSSDIELLTHGGLIGVGPPIAKHHPLYSG